MRTYWSSLGFLLLLSCSPFPERYAKVESVSPPGAPTTHRVFLQAPTGSSGCSPHAGYYKEIAWLSIRLPERPAAQARYDASQVAVFNENLSSQIAIASGYVALDRARNEVVVSLQTPTGAFWANGAYPARWQ